MKARIFLTTFLLLAVTTLPPTQIASGLDCKTVNRYLQTIEKNGKTNHKAFENAFNTFQKNRFSDASYWRAFKLKYALVKSDVESGQYATRNARCFTANQVSFINSYLRDRREILDALTPYLSQPPNREWIYSGYAGYVSLNYSLKGF